MWDDEGWPDNSGAHMTQQHQPVTLERLDQALVRVAFLMELHGPVLAPIFERLEREADTMRSHQDAAGRAKRLLDSYRVAGGVKAIA